MMSRAQRLCARQDCTVSTKRHKTSRGFLPTADSISARHILVRNLQFLFSTNPSQLETGCIIVRKPYPSSNCLVLHIKSVAIISSHPPLRAGQNPPLLLIPTRKDPKSKARLIRQCCLNLKSQERDTNHSDGLSAYPGQPDARLKFLQTQPRLSLPVLFVRPQKRSSFSNIYKSCVQLTD